MLFLFSGVAGAGVLYRWVDVSGQTRFGYRPPPGVQASMADEKSQAGGDRETPSGCRELMQAHVLLVDREIARVKAAPAGLGIEYEFTPEGKRRLLNDLLAHRAALITGRPASEFAPPDPQPAFERTRAHYERERAALQEELADQERRAQRLREDMRRSPIKTFVRGWHSGWRW
jgi:hypothetical protein